MSTIGLLMCHLYWLTKQQDECTVASAFTSLECFLQRGLCGASCFCFVEPATAVEDLEECWPLSHGPVALAVEGPMVRIDGLAAIPQVWEELEPVSRPNPSSEWSRQQGKKGVKTSPKTTTVLSASTSRQTLKTHGT